MDCVKKWVFNSSILLEIFSFVSKCLPCNREQIADMRQKEWLAKTDNNASATP